MEELRIKDQPSLRLERFYPVAPQKVWRAWTDPQALKRWFGPGEADKVTAVELDLRVGGRYRIVFGGDDGRAHEVQGVYREVMPHRRLAFTWTWPRTTPERESLVTLELNAVPGGTELVLRHEQFFDEQARDGHGRGWTHSLVNLERALQEDGEATRRVVQDYFAALARKDGWERFLADTMAFTIYTNPIKRLAGKSAYVESTRGFFSMVRSVELRDLIVDGASACALTRYELQPPHGAAFQSDVAEIFTVRGSQIVSFAIYFDSAPFPKAQPTSGS
jgi:uncharacterized protein YndB with AHSA1/START domain/ketosteroid isomerase-like protein